MQYASHLACIVVLTGMMAGITRPQIDDKAAVNAVLTDFHDAASDADFDRYFAHFATGAVFLGTDPDERWTVDEFKAFARPHFDSGTGWTYTMRERHIATDDLGNAAWFDEVVVNAKYGACRGTGVLVKNGGTWKIVQYNLTLPVPNEVAADVVKLTRELDGTR